MNSTKNKEIKINQGFILILFIVLFCACCTHKVSAASDIELSNSSNANVAEASDDVSTISDENVEESVFSDSNSAQATSLTASATNSYDIRIHGYLCVTEANQIMTAINQLRSKNGVARITWDSNIEEDAISRAAELSFYYNDNFIRPDGTKGQDLISGVYSKANGDTASNWINRSLQESTMKKWMLDSAWTHGAVGIVQSDTGICYVSLFLSTSSEGGKSTSQYENHEVTIDFPVVDDYVNPTLYLFDSKLNIYKNNTLSKGSTYYCYLMNDNGLGDYRAIYSQTLKSSNSKVVSISNNTTLKANYPGVAKITLKPASASGKSYSKTLVVLPSKVTGVKLTAKKKAMKVSWKKTTGAAGYKIYRATSKNGKYSCVKTVSSKTSSFTNKKLKKKKKYYYKVCAYVKSGSKAYNGSCSSIASKKTK